MCTTLAIFGLRPEYSLVITANRNDFTDRTREVGKPVESTKPSRAGIGALIVVLACLYPTSRASADPYSLAPTRDGLPAEADDQALSATEVNAVPSADAEPSEAERTPDTGGASPEVEAEPISATAGAPPETATVDDSRAGLEAREAGVSVPGLVLTSAGAAGIITGGILFTLAASQSAELADAEPGTEWTGEMQDDFDRVTALRVGGGVVMQAGAILVGVGVVLLLGDTSDGNETEASRLEVRPLGKGVDLKWRF